MEVYLRITDIIFKTVLCLKSLETEKSLGFCMDHSERGSHKSAGFHEGQSLD